VATGARFLYLLVKLGAEPVEASLKDEFQIDVEVVDLRLGLVIFEVFIFDLQLTGVLLLERIRLLFDHVEKTVTLH